MALVFIGFDKDFYGRKTEMYKDTDDLEQAEYHYYCRAKDIQRFDIASAILKGRIDAYDIKHNVKYRCITDDLAYTMCKLALDGKSNKHMEVEDV